MVAIVLLPGMDGTGAMYSGFASTLKEKYRTIIVSYPENQPLGYHELEAFARTALPTNEPFIFPGESFSGPIAISLAASKPAGLMEFMPGQKRPESEAHPCFTEHCFWNCHEHRFLRL